LEKVGKTVESKQSTSGDGMETKADDAEKDGEDNEASDLDGFAAESVDRCNRHPVTRNETCDGEDKISDAIIVESWVSKSELRVLLVNI
jgi:hypothetical protein